MKTAFDKKTISSREFIAMIRSRLDATGHANVAIERRWIDTDTPGEPFLLNVPVTSDLVVPLMPSSELFGPCRAEVIEREAAGFATALINLRHAAGTLARYAENVRRSARKAVDAARADGVDLILEGVGFRPTKAWNLSSASWQDCYNFVLAEVRIRSTSSHFKAETREILVSDPESVAEDLEGLVEEQRERQIRMAALEARGADLELDAITLDLIEAHGLEPAQVLRDVWKQQRLSLSVGDGDERREFSVTSSEGKVEALLLTPEACWNGRHLWFRDGHPATGFGALVGKSLGDRISDPVFAARPIVAVDVREQQRADLIHFDLSDKLLFDGETGRIWREERLAA